MVSQEKKILDLNIICRLCATKQDDLIPIFTNDRHLENKIKQYLSIVVKRCLFLPTRCCMSCFNTIMQWHDFIETTVAADKHLRTITGLTTNIIKPSDIIKHEVIVKEEQKEQKINTQDMCKPTFDETTPFINIFLCQNCKTKFDNADVFYQHIESCGADVEYSAVTIKECKPNIQILNSEILIPKDDSYMLNPAGVDPIPLNIFLCHNCTSTFTDEHIFYNHLRTCNQIDRKPLTNLDQMNINIIHETSSNPTKPNVNPNRTLTEPSQIQNHEKFERNQMNGMTETTQKPHRPNITIKSDVLLINPKNYTNTCSICKEHFASKSDYLKHNHVQMQFHRNICDVCQQQFDTPDLLLIHRKWHFTCTKCNESFPNHARLRAHAKTHRKPALIKSFKCDVCSKSFLNSTGLMRHKKNFHSTQVKTKFTCRKCNVTFNERAKLQKHIFKFHQRPLRLACEICLRRFSRAFNLTAHLATHIHDNFCDKCACSFNDKDDLNSHKCQTTSTEMCCPFVNCHQSFNSRLKLYEHKKNHLQIVDYTCDTCTKKFTTLSNLRAHKVHNCTARECHVCRKTFMCQKSLSDHLRVHNGLKPHVCDTCNKSFRYISNLNQHKRGHSNDKRFKCEICDKRFLRRNYLTQHLRAHVGEKQFPCTCCEKRFVQKNILVRHAKSQHRVCAVCNLMVGNKGEMRRHLLNIHYTREKCVETINKT